MYICVECGCKDTVKVSLKDIPYSYEVGDTVLHDLRVTIYLTVCKTCGKEIDVELPW